MHVVPGANALDLRALRVVKPTLEASVRFDRTSYAVGDTIREHVRITNTGTADITGITALCTGPGNPNELPVSPLRAGETRDFTFTDVVPQGGYDYGDVHLYCLFAPGQDAPPPSTSDDLPRAQARGAGVHTGLADTGASVRELTGIGIGLLLVGFWLLVLPMRARREP